MSSRGSPSATVHQKVKGGAMIEDSGEYFQGKSNYLEQEDLSIRWKVNQPDENDPTTWRTVGRSITTALQSPSPYPVVGVKSLTYLAENALMKQLRRDLRDEEFASNYCCGGEVPIAYPDQPNISPQAEQLFSPPVTIRWDARSGPLVGGKMKFPTSVSLSPLIKDCSPLWTNGQRIWKLDSSQISTDFSPQNVGITAAIQKVMLPMAARERYASSAEYCSLERMGIMADLNGLKVRFSRKQQDPTS